MDDSRLRLINPAYLAVRQVLRGLRSAGGRPKVSLRTNVRRVVAQAQAICRRRRENVIEMATGRSQELRGKQLLGMTKKHLPPGFGQCTTPLPLAHQSACRE